MKIIGHRGDGASNETPELRKKREEQGRPPENTIAAFLKAIEDGVDGIEFDIIISKDGRAMVIHDDDLSIHTIDGEGFVSQKTCEELHEYDVGQGNKIPTLEEVFDACGKSIEYNIELKSDDAAKPVSDIAKKYIKKGYDSEKFLFSSFRLESLKELREYWPGAKIGMLFEYGANIDDLERLVDEYNPFGLNPDTRDLSEELLTTMQESGIRVVAWTKDEPLNEQVFDPEWLGKLANFINKGYDLWLITDHPKLLRQELEKLCNG